MTITIAAICAAAYGLWTGAFTHSVFYAGATYGAWWIVKIAYFPGALAAAPPAAVLGVLGAALVGGALGAFFADAFAFAAPPVRLWSRAGGGGSPYLVTTTTFVYVAVLALAAGISGAPLFFLPPVAAIVAGVVALVLAFVFVGVALTTSDAPDVVSFVYTLALAIIVTPPFLYLEFVGAPASTVGYVVFFAMLVAADALGLFAGALAETSRDRRLHAESASLAFRIGRLVALVAVHAATYAVGFAAGVNGLVVGALVVAVALAVVYYTLPREQLARTPIVSSAPPPPADDLEFAIE